MSSSLPCVGPGSPRPRPVAILRLLAELPVSAVETDPNRIFTIFTIFTDVVIPGPRPSAECL
jgi:hypothetical protein